MNLDLRQAIIANIKGKNEEQLMDMVETALEDHEEKTLPGLGVIFEVIWSNIDKETKSVLIKALSSNI